MKQIFLAFPIALLLFFGCNTASKVASVPAEVVKETPPPAPVVEPPTQVKDQNYSLPVYNASYTRTHDIIHTKLDLKFDWAKESVLGKATITSTPLFYPSDQIRLDAVDFDIHQVKMEGTGTNLKYDYDDKSLTIQLGKMYEAGEKYTLFIDYTAHPSGTERNSAISSDKGLFFINADGSDPEKPQQIWTQGETENNSRWFPTVDKPNERCTQEMYLTVQDKYKTLSNGLLISSNKNSDGTRTDYWKMDQPHAPYLFMIAIGDFAVVEDSWNGILVDYYVEPKFEQDAKEIFPHTPEMLSFFSEKLDYKYPWQKYSQVVVRDYVSGAMENTTGVIFGEFVQKPKRELIDESVNELIVAHELFHHWFGDLVTCESWANLTMNEGFANYSEYLWFEHKYGVEEAERHRRNEIQGYIGSTQQAGIHPLIHFGYADKEHMFDAHSYNKGGLVLHMLRNQIGDDAFWATLNLYLKDNEYTAVEAHDLRLAVEEITGQDFNWFFDQWYFSAGHPQLEISYDYKEATKTIDVTIEQKQDPVTSRPIFILPMAIDIYTDNGMPMRKEIKMDSRKQTFSFDVNKKPLLVNVDADKVLLCEKEDKKSEEAFIFQYHNAKNLWDKIEAFEAIKNSDNPKAKEVFKTAVNDSYWGIRERAIGKLDVTKHPEITSSLAKLVTDDPKSQVRSAALKALGQTKDVQYTTLAKKAISSDQAYNVISAGLQTLADIDQAEALTMATKMEKEENGSILFAIGKIYAQNPDKKYLPFFEKSWDKMNGYGAINFFGYYLNTVKEMDDETVMASMTKLKDISTNMGQNPWRRFGAAKAINDLRGEYSSKAMTDKVTALTELINEIKSAETNGQLKNLYESF